MPAPYPFPSPPPLNFGGVPPPSPAGLVSAEKSSLEYLLSRAGGGQVAVIALGGPPESLDAHPGGLTLQILGRKGFVRIALEHGSAVGGGPGGGIWGAGGGWGPLGGGIWGAGGNFGGDWGGRRGTWDAGGDLGGLKRGRGGIWGAGGGVGVLGGGIWGA